MSPRVEVAEETKFMPEDVGAEMVRYAITRVPTDMFHYQKYRYARLSDALAQAKRDASGASGEPEKLDTAVARKLTPLNRADRE